MKLYFMFVNNTNCIQLLLLLKNDTYSKVKVVT